MSEGSTDLRRWATSGMDASSVAALAKEMAATELWSLLLTVMERRAAARSPATLMQQWAQDRFVVPTYIDQRTLLAIDQALFAAAHAFEAIELAPLAPLGVCSVVALTSQNRVVSTTRGTEVVSDPTNVLALESASRLRKDASVIVRLATSHRCVRAQEVPKLPGFAAHFRMFAMTTAGHETKDQAFVVEALIDHIRTHLSGLDGLERIGYAFPERSLKLLATPPRAHLAQRVAAAFDDVPVVHDPLTKDYYDGLRFMISARSAHGDGIPLIDGGAFNWLTKLASNRKLVLVASAIGSQIVAYAYNNAQGA
jgi:hypothetical protein